jgi:drug/metabolite transporter (DMT)-like permease
MNPVMKGFNITQYRKVVSVLLACSCAYLLFFRDTVAVRRWIWVVLSLAAVFCALAAAEKSQETDAADRNRGLRW